MSRGWKEVIIGGAHDYQVKTADSAIPLDFTMTYLSGASNALTAAATTLAIGQAGEYIYIGCSNHAAAIAITVTNCIETNNIFTFAAVGDYIILYCNGQKWELVFKTDGVTQSV
jgi:hypothetical protein